MLSGFILGFTSILTIKIFLLILLGVVVGIIFGAIPGLSAAMAVVLFLPMTFGMDPIAGMALICGLYIGGISGGLITAILLKIPGTPSSIATCFDGSPMAARGEAGKALGIGIVFSFLGGLFSFLVLFFIAPPLADVAIQFGAFEYFALAIFSLTMIASMSGGSLAKGLASGVIGIVFALAGLAPVDALPRYTFGIHALDAGFDLLPVLIGLFAITEIVKTAEADASMKKAVIQDFKIKGFGFSMKEFMSQKVNFVRSSLIGTGIGILPGIGGGTSNLLAYMAAKDSDKNPERFGTGVIDGIVASETANNASVGGALVPLLTLGIPGDAVTAMVLGAFMVHGISPGPLLFINNKDLVYSIFASLLVANVMMLIVEFYGLRIFVKMLKIPKHYLLPIIFALCAVGAYGLNNRVFDVATILIFGFIGYSMEKLGLPLTPVILGFILGPIAELNLRRGLQHTNGDFIPFLTSPIAAFFLLIALYVSISTVRKNMKRSKEEKERLASAISG
ncbi:MAG: tripartite tricarboxylate transporter permease [Clostridia bacterium]